MPYVTQDRKNAMAAPKNDRPDCAGELNYMFTVFILHMDPTYHDELMHHEIDDYIARKGLRYQFCNDCMGALSGAKREARRRLKSRKFDKLFDRVHDKFYDEVVGPYEDLAITKNGDVYPPAPF